jgi:hypothetical protein
MFEWPIIQNSIHMRVAPAQWLSESVATARLILIVFGSTSSKPQEGRAC